MQKEIVNHTLKPFVGREASILILGTMPSPKSREVGFYYGHPQNRFWKVLSGVFEEATPISITDKKQFLSDHHIALWDVLASCMIRGASDNSISHPVYNDIEAFVKIHEINAVITTGKKAGQLFVKKWPEFSVPHYNLPSTSPANAAMSLEMLILEYQKVLNYVFHY